MLKKKLTNKHLVQDHEHMLLEKTILKRSENQSMSCGVVLLWGVNLVQLHNRHEKWGFRKCKDYTKSYSLNRLRRAHSEKCQRGLVNLPASHPKRSGTFEAFGHCISFGIVLALPIFAVGKLFSSFLTSCSSSAEQATAHCHADMNKVFILLRISYSDKKTRSLLTLEIKTFSLGSRTRDVCS